MKSRRPTPSARTWRCRRPRPQRRRRRWFCWFCCTHGEQIMSALVKTLHPDEKVKAGKLGSSLSKAGAGIAVLFLGVSVVLGAMAGDNWKRFFHAYVIGWSYIFSI